MRDVAKLGVTTGEMARFTGMSDDFIRDEIAGQELRAGRFGRQYRISVDEARRYLDSKGFPLPIQLRSCGETVE